jgi:hypothetical protein
LTENKAWPAGIDKTAATAVSLAHEQSLALPGEGGTAALVKRLAGKLLDLDREIKDIDKTITERFRAHPHARIIESLPGFGPGLGAEFLVITGGDVTLVRHCRTSGLVRRIGVCAKRFRPCQR